MSVSCARTERSISESLTLEPSSKLDQVGQVAVHDPLDVAPGQAREQLPERARVRQAFTVRPVGPEQHVVRADPLHQGVRS